jgi:hypothetical protein
MSVKITMRVEARLRKMIIRDCGTQFFGFDIGTRERLMIVARGAYLMGYNTRNRRARGRGVLTVKRAPYEGAGV